MIAYGGRLQVHGVPWLLGDAGAADMSYQKLARNYRKLATYYRENKVEGCLLRGRLRFQSLFKNLFAFDNM